MSAKTKLAGIIIAITGFVAAPATGALADVSYGADPESKTVWVKADVGPTYTPLPVVGSHPSSAHLETGNDRYGHGHVQVVGVGAAFQESQGNPVPGVAVCSWAYHDWAPNGSTGSQCVNHQGCVVSGAVDFCGSE